MGATSGAGFGWQDINAYKLGVSHAYSPTFTVRAGYDHCDQPIPNSQTLLNIVAPGIVQDHLTLGGTWTLADKSEISVAYVHAFKKTVNGSGYGPGSIPGTVHRLLRWRASKPHHEQKIRSAFLTAGNRQAI